MFCTYRWAYNYVDALVNDFFNWKRRQVDDEVIINMVMKQ